MKTRLLSAVVPWLVLAPSMPAEAPPVLATPSSFTRFVEDETGARLQTGIGSYRNKDGVTVDLIGAIHIADRAYYERLNRRFERYPAMLYEMVGESFEKRKQWSKARAKVEAAIKKDAPEKSDPKAEERVKAIEAYVNSADPLNKDGAAAITKKELKAAEKEKAAASRMSWLHPLYETMERTLGLSGQLSVVDYTKPNFVHADMTAVQFAAMQKQKGESFLSLMWKSFETQLTRPEKPSQNPGLLKILEVLMSKDRTTELKRIVGRMFGDIEDQLSGIEGEDGSVILTERNKVALKVMEKQIGKGQKNLAIFYGAAHLQDMEKRLLAMGFTRVGFEWMTAWDLPPEKAAAGSGAVDGSANGK